MQSSGGVVRDGPLIAGSVRPEDAARATRKQRLRDGVDPQRIRPETGGPRTCGIDGVPRIRRRPSTGRRPRGSHSRTTVSRVGRQAAMPPPSGPAVGCQNGSCWADGLMASNADGKGDRDEPTLIRAHETTPPFEHGCGGLRDGTQRVESRGKTRGAIEAPAGVDGEMQESRRTGLGRRSLICLGAPGVQAVASLTEACHESPRPETYCSDKSTTSACTTSCSSEVSRGLITSSLLDVPAVDLPDFDPVQGQYGRASEAHGLAARS